MALSLDKILISVRIPCNICDGQPYVPDGYSLTKPCEFCYGSGKIPGFISGIELKSLLDGYSA